MMLGRLWARLSGTGLGEETAKPQTGAEQPNRDGSVTLENGRLVIQDPADDGRFATIMAELPVILWLNGEQVSGQTVIAQSDESRLELRPDPDRFFELAMDPERMTVTLRLTADPNRIPDIVEIVGEHRALLRAGYSPQAALRPKSPRTAIGEAVDKLHICYGIDEQAIDQELKAPTGLPVVIARGQEADPGEPGVWVWRAGTWALVEVGQVLAIRQGGRPVRDRISVIGETTSNYPEPMEEIKYLAGTGTRLINRDRLVATSSGRARRTDHADGCHVDVGPVQVIEGDLTQDLTVLGGLILSGNLRGARVRATDEVVIDGNVEDAHVHAGSIRVKGQVEKSRLYTSESGHYAPLKAELSFVHRRFEEVREALVANRPVPETDYRTLAAMVRSIRTKATEMSIDHPGFLQTLGELTTLFRALGVGSSLHLGGVERVCHLLSEFLALKGDQGSVEAGSLFLTSVWSAADIRFEEKCVGSSLFCGGAISAPANSVCAQSEAVAAERVILGVVRCKHGERGVTVRSRRLEAEEIQAGTAFEFGSERVEFRSEQRHLIAGINPKGQIGYKRRSS